jgi:hypothetical protein
MVAEGVELETNLLRASHRIAANSGVLDVAFRAHRTFYFARLMSAVHPIASNNIAAQRMTLSAKRVISRCTKTMKLFRRSTLPGIAVQLELTGEKKAAN